MTSKRNSRVYHDEHHHQEHTGQQPQQQAMEASRYSRRNSRICTKEDLLQLPMEMEEKANTLNQPKEATLALPNNPQFLLATDTLNLLDQAPNAPISPITSPSQQSYVPPMEGRPFNFGLVIPGVYRSSYPKVEDHEYLRNLNLKTIVTLVKRDEEDHDFASFVNNNNIRHVIVNMKGTKKEAIPIDTMTSILGLVLDERNYPLLLHCNHGKHRTGCVVAVVRKLSGWDVNTVLDEYKTYATPKIRECDVDYITQFQVSTFQSPGIGPVMKIPSRFSPSQVRTFFRTALFSAVVMTIWTMSGSKLMANQESQSNLGLQ